MFCTLDDPRPPGIFTIENNSYYQFGVLEISVFAGEAARDSGDLRGVLNAALRVSPWTQLAGFSASAGAVARTVLPAPDTECGKSESWEGPVRFSTGGLSLPGTASNAHGGKGAAHIPGGAMALLADPAGIGF